MPSTGESLTATDTANITFANLTFAPTTTVEDFFLQLSQLATNDEEEVTLLEDRWQFLTMMHAIMRSGSDPYLRSAWCDGNQTAAIAVYERFHHTNPDDRTSARATALFGRIWPANT